MRNKKERTEKNYMARETRSRRLRRGKLGLDLTSRVWPLPPQPRSLATLCFRVVLCCFLYFLFFFCFLESRFQPRFRQ
ncbi:unnamed protein product [Linum trigynum]|uniref:Transmembrane protein n=1 Tax=Linum trigynum TaxID=586398 RepID=A0AAV2G8M1_9ROSI